MFMSEYTHSLDTKGRLIVPQKFREQLGAEFVICRGMDHCLNLYTMEGWEEFTAKLQQLPELSNAYGRKVIRFFIAGAEKCEIDRQGRVLIPAGLRAFAGLKKDVVLAGAISRIEIWDKDAWEAYNNYDDVESLGASLKAFQI